ncbi:MAG: KamA family radical SAM protein, partial [Actinomycetota bacterium]
MIAVPRPYSYPPDLAFEEPDRRRIPGFGGVSQAEWDNAQWQRRNSVRNVHELKQVFGDLLPEDLALSIEADRDHLATMSMLVTPQMLNTMNENNLWTDPIRRYMIPALADRDPHWPSHPMAQRDSLHEAEMWAVEGLTHRYPTKVLAELLVTCPQYCGHCTRMDLVGESVPQVTKRRFDLRQGDRYDRMIEYLERTPTVRDVVVSGGDIGNVPIAQLESFVGRLLEIDHIQDIRLATKGLIGLPQHFLQEDVLKGLERIARRAIERDVDLAIHTHANHARSLTPVVAKVVKTLFSIGIRHVRNQGVLLRGVNDSQGALLDLCFALQDHAKVTPYYMYMCDMIPNAEHWRVPLYEAQALQSSIMGYLPGFATPRIVCDVPFVGKKWVHQVEEYDRTRGISYWSKSYLTAVEMQDPAALGALHVYYDPIGSLPDDGKSYWGSAAELTL